MYLRLFLRSHPPLAGTGLPNFRRAPRKVILRLLRLLPVLLLLACPRGWSVGFGPLVHQSDIGQHLDIEVRLIVPAQGDETRSAEVSIADNEAYAAMGVERPTILDGATISTEPVADGLLVRVRTREGVMEPFLALILQVQMPSGVLRHEYDMLFDPPRQHPADTAAPVEVAEDQPAAEAAESAPVADAPKAERHSRDSRAKSRVQPVSGASPVAAAPVQNAEPRTPPADEPQLAAAPAPNPMTGQSEYGLWHLDPVLHEIPSAPPSRPALTPSVVLSQPAVAPPAVPERSSGLRNLLLLLLVAGIACLWRFRHRLSPVRADAVPLAEIPGHSASAAASETQAASAARQPIEFDPGEGATLQRDNGIEVIDSGDFYDEVAALLEQIFEQDPQRLDLAQKLAEVYTDADRPEKLRALRKRLAEPAKPWEAVAREEAAALLKRIDERLAAAAPSTVVSFSEVEETGTGPSGFNRYYESPEFEGLDRQLGEVRAAYEAFRKNTNSRRKLVRLVNAELGRPSALQPALHFGHQGAKIYFKRDDVRLLDSELAINMIGQMYLMQGMGKAEIVTSIETPRGAGAVVLAAKALKLPATVYVRPELMRRLDAALLALARKQGVDFTFARDPRDPRRDALSMWLRRPDRVGYVTGLRAGPDPYPSMVMDFTSTFGLETRQQLQENGCAEPAAIVASARGGFNAIGFVKPFIERQSVRIVMADPPPKLLAVGAVRPEGDPWFAWREHRWLQATGRVEYLEVEPEVAAAARVECDRVEEFMPLPEDAAAVGIGLRIARELPSGTAVVIQLSAARAA